MSLVGVTALQCGLKVFSSYANVFCSLSVYATSACGEWARTIDEAPLVEKPEEQQELGIPSLPSLGTESIEVVEQRYPPFPDPSRRSKDLAFEVWFNEGL